MEEVMRESLLTTEQMRDERILWWVIRQHDAARVLGDGERLKELEAPFTKELVCHWLQSKEKMLAARLLETIPTSLFMAVAPDLEERYFQLATEVAHALLFRLAATAPLRAVALLEEVARRATGPRHTRDLTLVVQVARVVGRPANQLLRRLVETCTGRSAGYHMYWSGLFRAMVSLDLEDGPQRIAMGLIATDGPGSEGELIMHDIFSALAPGCPFMDMLMDIEFRQSGYRFADIPELFGPKVAVEEFDRLAEAEGHSLLNEAVGSLPEVGPAAAVARFARSLAMAMPLDAPARVLRLTHLLAVAAFAAQYQCTADSWKDLQYKQLLEVASADIQELPHEAELLAQLVLRTGKQELPALHRELEAARFYRGASRLVRVLSDMRQPASMSALLWCLDIETDEGAAELAVLALARYGDAVLTSLREGWSEMDEFSRTRALEVVALVGGPSAADHLLHFFADAVQDELSMGAWCDAAAAIPDGRYLALLESRKHGENDLLKQTMRQVKALVA
jgi:hypothetical protein